MLALASGALLLAFLTALFGGAPALLLWLALAALVLAAIVKQGYWRSIDSASKDLTTADATGLAAFGSVRQLDPPHSQANFVMREMGFAVARKHALKLRRIALVAGFLIPAALVLLALASGGFLAGFALFLAVLSSALGLVVERWLFFAEAQHVVTLYYGRASD